MLEAGIKGQHTIIVEKENTAAVMKSGTLAVFATPAMIALIEETAWKSVADELEEGCVTVGTSLNVKHLAASPVGMKVTCNTTLVEVDKRRLVFSVEVEVRPEKSEKERMSVLLYRRKNFRIRRMPS